MIFPHSVGRSSKGGNTSTSTSSGTYVPPELYVRGVSTTSPGSTGQLILLIRLSSLFLSCSGVGIVSSHFHTILVLRRAFSHAVWNVERGSSSLWIIKLMNQAEMLSTKRGQARLNTDGSPLLSRSNCAKEPSVPTRQHQVNKPLPDLTPSISPTRRPAHLSGKRDSPLANL